MTEVQQLAIPDVVKIIPQKFGDHRGYFSETFKQSTLADRGFDVDWVQENQSFSAVKGTVRGLHFQAPPFAQAKLVRVLRGAIYDVAVDIRTGSTTYGKWVAAELSAERMDQLFVPAGFAHGFMTLEDNVEVLYKVSSPYDRDSEGCVNWADADLGIAWPNIDHVTLSGKDAEAPSFAGFLSPFAVESH